LAGSTWWNLADVSSTTTAMTLSDNSITNGSIDNANFSCMILCAENDNPRANTVYIYGMRITYTVDGPE